MSAPAAPVSSARSVSTLNLPFLLGTAVVCGFGLFSMTVWMVTQSWLWFGTGIPSIVIGALLLFHRGTGSETA